MTLCVLLGVGGEILFEKFHSSVFKVCGLMVSSPNGGYVPPTEIVESINNELKEKVSQIVGEYRAQHHLVVVCPMVSGYVIKMAGPSNSNFWDESIQTSLSSWVRDRICTLDSELKARHNKETEQVGGGNAPEPPSHPPTAPTKARATP